MHLKIHNNARPASRHVVLGSVRKSYILKISYNGRKMNDINFILTQHP